MYVYIPGRSNEDKVSGNYIVMHFIVTIMMPIRFTETMGYNGFGAVVPKKPQNLLAKTV